MGREEVYKLCHRHSMELLSVGVGNAGCNVIEPVRTWQTKPPGVLDDRTRVSSGQLWRCTKCDLYFTTKLQANEHMKEQKHDFLV
jgi:hypothetical protein